MSGGKKLKSNDVLLILLELFVYNRKGRAFTAKTHEQKKMLTHLFTGKAKKIKYYQNLVT